MFIDPAEVVSETIDLKGRYVVPPYGEAHNHWLEARELDNYVDYYLWRGVFYVGDQANFPVNIDRILPEVNRPESLDLISAKLGITGPGGHPIQIAKAMQQLGSVPAEWKESEFDGRVVLTASNVDELHDNWNQYLACKPDFTKIFLLYSEQHDERKDSNEFLYRRGLDPQLVKPVVDLAHAAKLRVSAHVYTAADFRCAVESGVDTIAHLPGIGFEPGMNLKQFTISDDDAKLAASNGVTVITTLSSVLEEIKTEELGADYLEHVIRVNLERLQSAGVPIAIGSDNFRKTSDYEVELLAEFELMDPNQIIESWCVTTPQSVFPRRKIGKLESGYEASFLVLDANPLDDIKNARKISLRVKQGHKLTPDNVSIGE